MFRLSLVCAAAATLSLLAFGAASAEEGAMDGTRGYAEYEQYCASCHGPTGSGDGPMAADLKVRPADLRLLSARFGSPLPRARLAAFIDGRTRVRGHGSREMPVWGKQLHAQNQGGQAHAGHVRGTILVIIDYLETLQIQPDGDARGEAADKQS